MGKGQNSGIFTEPNDNMDPDVQVPTDEGLGVSESAPVVSGELIDDIAQLHSDGFSVDDDMDQDVENEPRREEESKTQNETNYNISNSRTICH